MFIFLSLCIFLFIVLIIYMVFLAYKDEITYEKLSFEKISPEFSPMNIFFIADIHRRKMKKKTLHKITERIDMVCIGGDLTERGVSLKRVHHNILLLKRWGAPIYFVWGNNDYEVNHQALISLLEQENVIILKDEFIEIDRDNLKFNVIGFDFHFGLDEELQSIDVAWEDIDDSFTILLTHHPESFYLLPKDKKEKIDLVLAGHTHGGQIRIFGFGLYTNGGIFTQDQTNIFITEGYGYSLLPLRLQTRAQCHVITIQNKE